MSRLGVRVPRRAPWVGRLKPKYTKRPNGANTVVLKQGPVFWNLGCRPPWNSLSGLKKETPLNLECSIKCPRSSDGIEHRISNPLARDSSPFGDTIYGFSSMERVSGYEPLDRGSTPLSCTRKFCLKSLIATSMRLQAVFIYLGEFRRSVN